MRAPAGDGGYCAEVGSRVARPEPDVSGVGEQGENPVGFQELADGNRAQLDRRFQFDVATEDVGSPIGHEGVGRTGEGGATRSQFAQTPGAYRAGTAGVETPVERHHVGIAQGLRHAHDHFPGQHTATGQRMVPTHIGREADVLPIDHTPVRAAAAENAETRNRTVHGTGREDPSVKQASEVAAHLE